MYTLCVHVCMYVCIHIRVFTNITRGRCTTNSAAATLGANKDSCRLAAVIAVPVLAEFVTKQGGDAKRFRFNTKFPSTSLNDATNYKLATSHPTIEMSSF